MASKTDAILSMPARSGLKSAAPATFLEPDELSVCENISFGLNAERKKRLGTTRYNAATIGAGANVVALQDFWRFGTSLTPTQKFVAAANGQLWQSPGDGTWTSILNPFGSNTSLITNIVIGQGFAVFSDGVSIPQKYDQAAVTALDGGAGTAPRFTAAAYHLSRLFTVGTAAHPSAFDVSAGGDITLWAGADVLLNVPLDNDDGDALIGISRTFHKRIYMFKGPTFGSIHEISGNTLSTLQHDRIFNGLPLLNNKALVTTPNDIFWLSRSGAHSLVTTQTYGDTTAAFLSEPIQDIWQSQLNPSALNAAVGFWNSLYGYVGWFVTPAGATTNQWALVYHYLISDPSPRGKKFWSVWKLGGSLAAYSANVMVTPANFSNAGQPRLYLGGSADGFVYAGDQTVLTDGNGSAYTARVKTGINLSVGQAGPLHEKQFYSVTTYFEPVGPYSHDLNITVDNRTQNFTLVMSGAGDVLG